MSTSAVVPQSSFTATIHAADGLRFVARARCAERLTEQLVTYVLARCEAVLWPAVAAQVRSLAREGRLRAAVDLYFAHVGERWDEEYLDVEGYLIGSYCASLAE